MRNVSHKLFQEGWSLNLGLRKGFGQVARTRNNPHVKCTGVLLYVKGVSYKKAKTQEQEDESCWLICASPLDITSENACPH